MKFKKVLYTLILCLFCVLLTVQDGTDAGGNDDILIYVDRTKLVTDVPPILENDRILVPMRAIFEALGAEVIWDNKASTATADKVGTKVVITIDQNYMRKNGAEILLDAPARLINDSRTMVPIRAVSEAFGAKVEWDEKNCTVKITKAPKEWFVTTEEDGYAGLYYYAESPTSAYYDLFSDAKNYSEGLAAVSQSPIHAKKKYYGYIDERGALKIPYLYTMAGDFHDGVAIVESDWFDEPYLIDKNGKRIDGKQPVSHIYPDEILFSYFENYDQWGFKNQAGEIAITPDYSYVDEFHEGLALVQIFDPAIAVHVEDHCGYINTRGQMVIPPVYLTRSTEFKDGRAVVFEYTQHSLDAKFINQKNETLFDGRIFADARQFSEGVAAVKLKGGASLSWTYMDENGKYIDERYEEALSFKDGAAYVKQNGIWNKIDRHFKIIERNVDAPKGY